MSYRHFTCTSCKAKCIRYPNTKCCPTCRKRTLKPGRLATEEERTAKFRDVMKKLNEIPD